MLIRKIISLAGMAVLLLMPVFSAFSQDTLPDISISLNVADKPLKEVLNLISEKSGIAFSYNTKKISGDKKITYQAENARLNKILDDIGKITGYQFTYVEEQIVIKPRKPGKSAIEKSFTVSGHILDKKNGEVLIGATVYIEELKTGTASNPYGFYSLTLPEGSYTLTYSFIGYREETQTIRLTSDIRLDMDVEESAPLLPEIIVQGSRPKPVEEIQLSNINLKPKEITEFPSLMGELDVIKSLQAIPGIKLQSDGSTYFSVRGGDKDQNLILIDEATIYNPSHLLGFFSTIVPDAVKDVAVYKSDIPASQGGRLSSLIDIKTSEGNTKKLQFWGSLGPVASKLVLEGPIKKDKSAFFIAGRRSNLNWFFNALNAKVDKLYFYDLVGKMNFKLNRQNRLYFSFYTGSDIFNDQNQGISWTNSTGTIRWNHLFSDRLFANTTFYGSKYDYFLYTDIASNDKWSSHIGNVSLKTDFTWFVRPDNMVTFGLGLSGYNFNPGNFERGDGKIVAPVVSRKNTEELIIYASQEITLNDHIGIKYGLRIGTWSNVGEAFEFVYDKNGFPADTMFYKNGENYYNFSYLAPRLTLSYNFSERASLKANYSRTVQNIHLITNSISPFTTLDVWLPSSTNVRPQTANQFSAGYFLFSQVTGVSLSVEGFYKDMRQLISYRDHAQMLLNPLFENEILFGKGRAYGLELLLRKEEGRVRGWTGYSWSKSKRQFDEINDGNAFRSVYDKPHEFTFFVSYDLTLRTNIGVNWIYNSGAVFTSPTSFYLYDGQEVPVYAKKNNDRMPDYHHLDLSATIVLNKNQEKFRHALVITLYNLYGRKNAVFINFNKTFDREGEIRIPGNLLDVSRITSQTYYYGFMPSIAYHFKFL